MIIARTPAQARKHINKIRNDVDIIGLVPTMGGLHDGHLSLVKLALERCDRVAVSIFVNPTQFGPGEDFERYPRDSERDEKILREAGCDLMFVPETGDIYSMYDRTRVSVKDISEPLCGSTRAGHFDGVALIVTKLFNIISPDMAFFGQKDAQQAVVIQRMAADLDFPVKVVLGPVIREPNGLAMSSRNMYLSEGDREKASSIFRALQAAAGAVKGGERDPDRVRDLLKRAMSEAAIDVEYAEVVDGRTMGRIEKIEGAVLIAVAARISGVRLIDNIALHVEEDRVEDILLEFPEWSRYE